VKLSEYKDFEPVFIDANIFIDYSLPNPKYGEIAADFLERVELLEIKAVTTPLVLDEVSYIILMYKGSLHNYKQVPIIGKKYRS
jgi:predicted nucleic acid-binding protein